MLNRCVLSLLLCLAATAVEARVIKIATVAPEGTAWMREMRAGAAEIKKQTEGRVTLKFYPGGVMGNDATVLRKIKVGQLQGGAFTGAELSLVYSDAPIYSLPFLFRSQAEVDYVRAKVDPLILAGFAKHGMMVPGLSGAGFVYLMSTREIRNKEDLRSCKVWVPQSDKIAQVAFESAGVQPIPLSIADVYTGLQTGLVDTVGNTPAGAILFQWHTRLKHMVDLPLTYVVGAVAIDQKVFESLDEKDQVTVRTVMAHHAAELDKINREDNRGARAELEKQGLKAVVPDSAQEMEWRAIGEKAVTRMTAEKDFSPELLAAIQAALAEYRANPANAGNAQ